MAKMLSWLWQDILQCQTTLYNDDLSEDHAINYGKPDAIGTGQDNGVITGGKIQAVKQV